MGSPVVAIGGNRRGGLIRTCITKLTPCRGLRGSFCKPPPSWPLGTYIRLIAALAGVLDTRAKRSRRPGPGLDAAAQRRRSELKTATEAGYRTRMPTERTKSRRRLLESTGTEPGARANAYPRDTRFCLHQKRIDGCHLQTAASRAPLGLRQLERLRSQASWVSVISRGVHRFPSQGCERCVAPRGVLPRPLVGTSYS